MTTKPTYIMEGHYLSKAEAAQSKGVAIATLQSWLDRGWLQSVYIGHTHLIRADELAQFTPPKAGRKSGG